MLHKALVPSPSRSLLVFNMVCISSLLTIINIRYLPVNFVGASDTAKRDCVVSNYIPKNIDMVSWNELFLAKFCLVSTRTILMVYCICLLTYGEILLCKGLGYLHEVWAGTDIFLKRSFSGRGHENGWHENYLEASESW
jgi:hypothetical protein